MSSQSISQPNDPEHGRATKPRRYLAAAALLGGGMTLGAVFSPIGLASADTADDATSTGDAADGENEDGTTEDGDRWRGGHRRGARLDEMSELLGLSEDELRAEFEAGNSLADIAAAQGISTEELTASMLAAVEEHLAEAVAEGRIDDAAAAERLARAEERIPEMIERTPGEGGGHAHRHRLRRGFGDALEELGISTEELQAGRESGKTLAEVAAEQGVAEDELVAALVDQAVERVDAAVEAGRIDADRAAEMKENAGERIAELIDQEPGDRDGAHSHWHRHGHRHGGRDGSAGNTGADAGETGETGYSA